MKKIFILLLLASSLSAQAQSILFYGNTETLWYALGLDGSTEYAYINNPTGLDLNSANYLSGSDADMTATYESDLVVG